MDPLLIGPALWVILARDAMRMWLKSAMPNLAPVADRAEVPIAGAAQLCRGSSMMRKTSSSLRTPYAFAFLASYARARFRAASRAAASVRYWRSASRTARAAADSLCS